MMRISPSQLDVFASARDREFIVRATNFLLEWFPDGNALARRASEGDVSQQVANARGYGLETEREIMHFVLAAAHFGASFDQDPEFKGRLSADASNADKVSFLEIMIQHATPSLAQRSAG